MDLCSLASEVGMSEFTEHLSLLTQLRDLWAEGKTFRVQEILVENAGL